MAITLRFWTEEMDATADDAIKDEWPGGPNIKVPRKAKNEDTPP